MRCWSMSAHWMWNSILKWSFDGTSGFRNQHVSTYVHQHSMWMRPEVKLSLWGPSHQTILSIITQNLSTHWCPARTDTGAVSLCGLLHSVNAVSGHWTRSCWETAQVKILRRLFQCNCRQESFVWPLCLTVQVTYRHLQLGRALHSVWLRQRFSLNMVGLVGTLKTAETVKLLWDIQTQIQDSGHFQTYLHCQKWAHENPDVGASGRLTSLMCLSLSPIYNPKVNKGQTGPNSSKLVQTRPTRLV